MKNAGQIISIVLSALLAGLVSMTPVLAQEFRRPPPYAAQKTFDLQIGEAKLLTINGLPKTIIVGDDTTIAANVIQENILVLTGLTLGRTNVIVLNDDGNVIEQLWVRIIRPGAPLTVRKGGIETEVFRCNPACRPEHAPPLPPPAGIGVEGQI